MYLFQNMCISALPGLDHMILRSADRQECVPHMHPPILSLIPMPTHPIACALQNYQTLEQFLKSLYWDIRVGIYSIYYTWYPDPMDY